MNAADYRMQEELEHERMEKDLQALQKISEAGLRDEAVFLASELGLTKQFIGE